MSKLFLRTVQAATVVALGMTTLTGTAQAGTVISVGCVTGSTQNNNGFVFNFFGHIFNGNNIGSNCASTAISRH